MKYFSLLPYVIIYLFNPAAARLRTIHPNDLFVTTENSKKDIQGIARCMTFGIFSTVCNSKLVY